VGGAGLEQTALTPSKTPIVSPRGTESGTLDAQNTPSDPDLALIVDRWANLPEHIRQAVLVLVRTPGG